MARRRGGSRLPIPIIVALISAGASIVVAWIKVVATFITPILTALLTPSPAPPPETAQAKTATEEGGAPRQLPRTQQGPEKEDPAPRPQPPRREKGRPAPTRTHTDRVEDLGCAEGGREVAHTPPHVRASAKGASSDLSERPQLSAPTGRRHPTLRPPAPAEDTSRDLPEQPSGLTAPQAPSRPAAPGEVEVEALAELENFRVPGFRPYLALEEEIEVTIAGRKVRLFVARGGPGQNSESLSLPEGEHRYTLHSTARARCYPEGGGWPVPVYLSGGGKGKVLVKPGTRLVLKREPCQGRYYPVRLEVRQ